MAELTLTFPIRPDLDAASVERLVLQFSFLSSFGKYKNSSLVVAAVEYQPIVEDFFKAYEISNHLLLAGSVDHSTDLELAWHEEGSSICVIIPCHNYGQFVAEAIDSVLSQSYQPDYIILSDDGSTDDSLEVIRSYERRYPGKFMVNTNSQLMGIEKHFNKIAGLSEANLLLFIGADNRIPENFVEKHLFQLFSNPGAAIAYSDFALFGNRSKSVYDAMPSEHRGTSLGEGVYTSNFPEFGPQSLSHLNVGSNFIHGSSMYRKSSFDRVGGYPSREDGAEDKGLFMKILGSGDSAIKVHGTFLEYRQHSSGQANQQFAYFGELLRLRRETIDLYTQLEIQRSTFEAEIYSLRKSRRYRVGKALLWPLNLFKR